MTVAVLILIFIGIVLFKHFVLWHPMDVSRLYRDGTLKIGHRGYPEVAPENTLPSYIEAVEAGLKVIEMDVISTKDGRVVCSHNHDLERETDGFGYIHEMTYGELVDVDAGVKFPEHSPSKLPLLEEVIGALPEDIFINVEIKAAHAFDFWKTPRKVVEIIKKYDLHQRVFVSSFHPFVIGMIKLHDSHVATAYIWDDENVPAMLRKPRFVSLVHPDMFHPAVHLVNGNTMRLAARNRLPVNVWTVNNRPAMEWLLKMGVDGIISDFPGLMHRAAEEFAFKGRTQDETT